MATGRIPRDCRWGADGAVTAPLPATKANSRRKMFWKHSAILGYASSCALGAVGAHLGCGAIRGFALRKIRPARDARNAAAGRARILLLRYVCERDHRPVEHGDLEFDLSRATWLRRHDDARIQKMAECFLESYLKKKA